MKENKKTPDIRFKGFTDDWEQRKFSDLVTIERGGSPRPIDKYITNDKNGLNWIKIGDAPEQGNYITQTAEKIKPEGLAKTREVHPGDLILSNSMSFGRPYIMAIDGCIHDGWLAIRDTEKNFDLKFLCTLLGTDNMLNQYKSMAAGSTVNNLNKELVGGTKVLLPIMNEQVQIGQYFSQIDNLITLHQRECDQLKELKKTMLKKMFPRDDSNIPEVRFAGFTDDWEQRKLGKISDKVINKNQNATVKEVFTNSAEFGIVSQRDFFEKDIANTENINGYYIVEPNDFVYNPRISTTAPFGPIKRNKLGRIGAMSPLYYVFRAHDINLDYLECYFQTTCWHAFMRFNGNSGARSDRFAITDKIFNGMPIFMSQDVEEQKLIGNYFSKLDNLITLHQRELKILKNLKKTCLKRMFI